MNRGYYAAVAGMVTAVRRMDVTINNLANAETPGYKQERSTAVTFSEALVEQAALQRPLGPVVLATAAQAPELDLSQGSLQPTGRGLDVALQGPGFLAAQGADGVTYTRDGSLGRDSEGYLTTSAGRRVLGDGGPIRVPDGPITIDPDGEVRAGDQQLGRLRLVSFDPSDQLQRVGSNELVARGGTPREDGATSVLQGFIESSNVDLTATMTSMLELQRAYEANQRMIRYQDELLSHAVNDVARPAS